MCPAMLNLHASSRHSELAEGFQKTSAGVTVPALRKSLSHPCLSFLLCKTVTLTTPFTGRYSTDFSKFMKIMSNAGFTRSVSLELCLGRIPASLLITYVSLSQSLDFSVPHL
jgi:hypothetical protein